MPVSATRREHPVEPLLIELSTGLRLFTRRLLAWKLLTGELLAGCGHGVDGLAG